MGWHRLAFRVISRICAVLIEFVGHDVTVCVVERGTVLVAYDKQTYEWAPMHVCLQGRLEFFLESRR
jgi:hypothetical protein